MATISDRIKEALRIRGLKQIDLSNLTGLKTSMISNYCKGNYKPKQDNIYLIAKALQVSPAWIMGLDVPMEDASVFEDGSLTLDEETLLKEFNRLSSEQKSALLSLIKNLR